MMVVFVIAAIILSWQITKPIMDVVKAADEILARMVRYFFFNFFFPSDFFRYVSTYS